MNTLGITRGQRFSTIYIHGNPPCGLPAKYWSALGELAHAVNTRNTEQLVTIPAGYLASHGNGWYVTARTQDIEEIRIAAESILSDSYTQLATYRNGA